MQLRYPIDLTIEEYNEQKAWEHAELDHYAPLRSWKLTDVTQGHTMGNFMVETFVWLMNKKKWESLPADVQKVMEELGWSMTMLAAHTLVNEGDWVIDALKKRGDAFYYIKPGELRDTWQTLFLPQYGAHAEMLSKRGMDGKAIVDRTLALSEETAKNPSNMFDDWWKVSRMGKLDKK
ncbi:conserved hypothetical protein [delta proteobacterium NaphS2]|nr:conserved hypothetical protein [delta proteobacterium NaphS2]